MARFWRPGAFSSAQRVCLTHLPWLVLERPCWFHSSRRTWSTASAPTRTTWNGAVEGDLGVRQRVADRLLVAARHVDRDRSDRGLAVAELVEEALERGAVAAVGQPNAAAGLVVGDDGQVAVALAIAHLVDADHPQRVQAAGVKALADDAVDDPPAGLPVDAHQRGDRRLGDLLGQERNDVLEVSREPGAARPRHSVHSHPAVRAVHAPDLGDEVAALRAQVQVSPAAGLGVVGRAADLPAARADPAPAPEADRHDHALRVEPDADHRRSRQPENAVECGADPHGAPLLTAACLQTASSLPETRACGSLSACTSCDDATSSKPAAVAVIPSVSSPTQTPGDPPKPG